MSICIYVLIKHCSFSSRIFFVDTFYAEVANIRTVTISKKAAKHV